MSFKVIETFSGIGAQAKALSRLENSLPNFKYKIVATVEWEIGAMYAYDLIHHGKQNLTKYDHHSKQRLIKILENYNLSSDGKQPIKKTTLNRMSEIQLKAILHSIENNNNLVDISEVHASDLPFADLLTYSFPCQDLSISSFWHKNFSGIDKESNNRSSLLWQIERILNEYEELGKVKPRFLLMENVTAIQSPMHAANFQLWKDELRRLGYESYPFNLDAKNFGIPQNRKRTYMISVLVGNYKEEISNYFNEQHNLNRMFGNVEIEPFLRLNYDIDTEYYREALKSTPNDTASRRGIYKDSQKLARGRYTTGNIARTITTKQDRNPNAGIIVHDNEFYETILKKEKKSCYRNLTPRETFMLMGFDEEDFQTLIDNNLNVSLSRKFLSHSKLLKLSGNSIVVNVLQAIFSEILKINNLYFKNNNEITCEKSEIK